MHTACLLPVSPSMHCSGGCTCRRGVYLPRGVYLAGGCTCRGGCTCPEGVPARGCTCPGGVPVQGGVPGQGVYLPRGVPAWGCTCPGTPPCEQNSWHTLLKILPCPKLRLRAVIIYDYILLWNWFFDSYNENTPSLENSSSDITLITIAIPSNKKAILTICLQYINVNQNLIWDGTF